MSHFLCFQRRKTAKIKIDFGVDWHELLHPGEQLERNSFGNTWFWLTGATLDSNFEQIDMIAYSLKSSRNSIEMSLHCFLLAGAEKNASFGAEWYELLFRSKQPECNAFGLQPDVILGTQWCFNSFRGELHPEASMRQIAMLDVRSQKYYQCCSIRLDAEATWIPWHQISSSSNSMKILFYKISWLYIVVHMAWDRMHLHCTYFAMQQHRSEHSAWFMQRHAVSSIFVGQNGRIYCFCTFCISA